MTLQCKYHYVICLQKSLKGSKGIFIRKSSYERGCVILLRNTNVKRSHQQRQKIWGFLKDPLAPVCRLPALPSSGNLPQALSPGQVPSSGLPQLHPSALITWWCHCSLLAHQSPHRAVAPWGLALNPISHCIPIAHPGICHLLDSHEYYLPDHQHSKQMQLWSCYYRSSLLGALSTAEFKQNTVLAPERERWSKNKTPECVALQKQRSLGAHKNTH